MVSPCVYSTMASLSVKLAVASSLTSRKGDRILRLLRHTRTLPEAYKKVKRDMLHQSCTRLRLTLREVTQESRHHAIPEPFYWLR